MKFKHFVILKFDYPEGYPYYAQKLDMLRWGLLQSLRDQREKEFTMVFASSRPMPHEGFGEIIISPVWRDKVRAACREYDYIITTRIDGDDFVTPDFIGNIHRQFEPSEGMVLQCDGWIFETRANMIVANSKFVNYTGNHISLVEKTDSPAMVYCQPHSRMKKHYPVKRDKNPAHVWVINDESLKAGSREPSRFIGNLPDVGKALFGTYPEAENICKRILACNSRIAAIKKKKQEGVQ